MIQRGNPNYPEINVSKYHFVHNQSIIDWPKKEPGTSWWKAGC
jgi:hypothetical protein